MVALSTTNLTLAYGDNIIIKQLNLAIPKGKITVLVGSNGCGKSTLLRSLARLLKPQSGTILLDGKSISELPTREIARHLAILPQGPSAPEGLTVYDLVKQGRYPHQNWLRQWSQDDEKMVAQALAATGITELADRALESLSGGQRQRAWIAMTLAQNTDTILLDEPTTYLDLAHQIDVLDLLFDLNEKHQRTIVMVLHDINLACRYAHHLIAVKDGTIYAQGQPEDIVTEDLMKQVFHMECKISTDMIYGTPLCIPLGKGRYVIPSKQKK